MRWEHFEHGADIGVRGIGPTPASAFEQAALALTAVITDPASPPEADRLREGMNDGGVGDVVDTIDPRKGEA